MTVFSPALRRTRPLLFDAFPSLASVVPWRPLAELPTPVERMTAIAGYLGRDDVWMKRDDLASPLYGGNKVRRFEHKLAAAEAAGARRLVTAGGLASTQVVATSIFGRTLGLGVRAVLFDQPLTAFARKAILTSADAGAELIYGGGYLPTALRTIAALRRGRRDNYLILPGASDPLSNLGYLDAMLELAKQVEAGEMPRPDAIVLPAGSSGTLAALAIGAAWLGWRTEILGVRITTALACNRLTVSLVARGTLRFLARHVPEFARLRLRQRLLGAHLGAGYGYPTPEAVLAIPEHARLTGTAGEVTYSGKALAALRAVCGEPRWRGRTILFWNTLSSRWPAISGGAIERVPPSLRFVFEGPEPAV